MDHPPRVSSAAASVGTDDKVTRARQAVQDRLISIEAAMVDLRSPEFRLVSHKQLHEDKVFQQRYANRVSIAALHLLHLKDNVERLAKRMGVQKGALGKALKSSQPIRVLANLANSMKHGLGGHEGHAALLNGFIEVQKIPEGASSPSDQVHLVGMVVVDAKKGAFPSATLLDAAIQHWGQILGQLGIDASWAERLTPKAAGPVVTLSSAERLSVPLGTTIVIPLPELLMSQLTADAAKRSRLA